MKKFIDESWLVLLMGICFAILLAFTQTSLQGRIDENRVRALNEAIAQVVPDVSTKEELEIDGNTVYKCLGADGNLVGWAVDATGAGFIDKIRVVVGLSPDGDTITGIKAVEHLETPGLGNKIDSGNPFPEQFTGRSAATALELVKIQPSKDNEIQAITGATYSSQYVMEIVNDVTTQIRPQLAEHR